MVKSKIAISLDEPLLDLIDTKVDGSVIRSRSQAIEYFLRKGLQQEAVSCAVILLRGSQHEVALKEFKGMSLIKQQIGFFSKCGIKNVFIITQHSKSINSILSEISDASINVEIVEKQGSGNAEVLRSVKDKIKTNFVVMSGDTYNDFDLLKMIKKQSESEKLATMGLMTREKTSDYGTAILDGDLIVDFKEKTKHSSTNIVNAGIYVFSPDVFKMLEGCVSLEKDLFPKIAKVKQLVGFFTYGQYWHFG